LGAVEIAFFSAAGVALLCSAVPSIRSYRSLLWGGALLLVISALFPRAGNALGSYLFDARPDGIHLPLELFGFAWWILGAWLVRSVLQLVLRRTVFPNDYQPHSRRLLADLAAGLVYVVAFVGIIETVLKQPIAGVLATSGVLAIVLGLALQNTLADVFSGLAINIEHPFGAGDWITLNGDVEGEVMEINWRATRIRSDANDTVVIPNSVIAKAIVTNHRRLNVPFLCTIGITVKHDISPSRVIGILTAAATGVPGCASGTPPAVYASGFEGELVSYQICIAVEEFESMPDVQSVVVGRAADALNGAGIDIGTAAMDIRLLARESAAPALHDPNKPRGRSDGEGRSRDLAPMGGRPDTRAPP
jgi:small-conductance mechanosensitive channel